MSKFNTHGIHCAYTGGDCYRPECAGGTHGCTAQEGLTASLKSWGSLSDFIRNATEEEKRAVYDIVMERANARQLATLETPHKPNSSEEA